MLRVHHCGVHNTVRHSGVHNTVHHSGVYNAAHHSGVHNTVHHRRNFRRNISVAGFLGRATKGANSSRVIPEDTIGSAEYPKISQLDSILDVHNIDSVTDI